MNLHRYRMFLAAAACLLFAGCRPSPPSISLHAAVENGDAPAVQQHIAARTDLNARDPSGWTPLHLAARKGDLAIVQMLSEAGADVRSAGPQGKTPLDVAREQRQTAVLEYLEARPERRGRGLIDGGLGVSDAMDAL